MNDCIELFLLLLENEGRADGEENPADVTGWSTTREICSVEKSLVTSCESEREGIVELEVVPGEEGMKGEAFMFIFVFIFVFMFVFMVIAEDGVVAVAVVVVVVVVEEEEEREELGSWIEAEDMAVLEASPSCFSSTTD